MLRPIRIAAGLGDPPSEFCTNDSEAINSSIKQFLHFKKSDWPIFNNKMKSFVMEQHEEVCKAVIGTGQYSLRKEYESLSVAPSDWFTTLNDEQRENAKRKFQEACVMSLQIPVNDQVSRGEEAEEEKSIGSSGEVISTDNKELSVDVETASSYCGIPTLVLRHIWAKAIDLLNSNQVLPAPGCAVQDRMVASTSKKMPHFVTATKDGRFECDENCPNFTQRYICSHCVAAAENNGSLETFVKYYGVFAKTPKGQKAITPNFTRLSMTSLTRQTAGRKGGKAPPKKTISRKRTIPYEQRQQRPSLVMSQTHTTPTSLMSASTSSPLAEVAGPSHSWDWSWHGIQQYSPFQTMHHPPYMPSYPSPYLPSSGIPPFTDFSEYCPPYPHNETGEPSSTSSNTNLNSPSTSGSNLVSEPFLIKMLNRRIKVCAGCKGQHFKNADDGLLSPPHDICLGHRESLSFINPRTGTECSKLGNAYYHFNLDCIRRKHPSFTAAQVECPPEVQEVLTEVHYDFLQEAIGYFN